MQQLCTKSGDARQCGTGNVNVYSQDFFLACIFPEENPQKQAYKPKKKGIQAELDVGSNELASPEALCAALAASATTPQETITRHPRFKVGWYVP